MYKKCFLFFYTMQLDKKNTYVILCDIHIEYLHFVVEKITLMLLHSFTFRGILEALC